MVVYGFCRTVHVGLDHSCVHPSHGLITEQILQGSESWNVTREFEVRDRVSQICFIRSSRVNVSL